MIRLKITNQPSLADGTVLHSTDTGHLGNSIRLREEIFSRLLSEVLASVQDSIQKEMGLSLEGLRQQLSKMITSSAQSTTQQAPDLANTQVGSREFCVCV